MPVSSVYVEKKPGFDGEAHRLCVELREILGVSGLRSVRILRRYDVENLPEEAFEKARHTLFCEPGLEKLYEGTLPSLPGTVLEVALPPGAYDPYADGMAQCLQLLTQDRRPTVTCAKVYALEGEIGDEQLALIRCHLADPGLPVTGAWRAAQPAALFAAIEKIRIAPSPYTAPIALAWDRYRDISGEIPGCAIEVDARVDGAREPWRVTLKIAPNANEAVLDALSEEAIAYQAMRVSGGGATVMTNAFAGYCNQIGLAVGKAQEVYHPACADQPFETVAVIAASPVNNLHRAATEPGDAVLHIGGHSVYTARGLQRLFRNPDFMGRVKRCTREGVEGMACVASPQDVAQIMRLASQENLPCALVGEATIASQALDTPDASPRIKARIVAPDASDPYPLRSPGGPSAKETWLRLLGDLSVRSQRGLAERFDSGAGGGMVIAPYGGAHRGTPNEAMAALLPVPGSTTTMTLVAHGCDPALCAWSPYHGAVYAVLEAIAKVVAAGGDAAACRLACQGIFPDPGKEPAKWGGQLAALLGALDAQWAMALAAIDLHRSEGESGTPFITIAFAMAAEDVVRVITPELKGPGHALARLTAPRDAALLPDYPALRAAYDAVHVAMRKRQILSAHTVGYGGLAAALTRMCLGNRIGCVINDDQSDAQLFLPDWGGLVVELADGESAIPGLTVIGHTTKEPVIAHGKFRLPLADALAAWEAPHSGKPATQASCLAAASPPQQVSFYAQRGQARARFRTARPRVCIPCFPGTNSEMDSARAFERAGASADVTVFRNTSPQAVTDSLHALAQAIGRAQIVMLPGGFTHGSGKFIAAALRDPRISDAIDDLLYNRDGLMLGICNGFQALVKLGLLPVGSMVVPGEKDPALAANALGRHVSAYAHTVVASVKSPWMAGVEPGQVHAIAMSHGQGRFVCGEARLKELYAAGQIITQYCEPDGTPTMRAPHNPNGSAWAVEGICSPDGRILGKMGHSERVGPGVAVNIPGEKDQRLFVSGVGYFS